MYFFLGFCCTTTSSEMWPTASSFPTIPVLLGGTQLACAPACFAEWSRPVAGRARPEIIVKSKAPDAVLLAVETGTGCRLYFSLLLSHRAPKFVLVRGHDSVSTIIPESVRDDAKNVVVFRMYRRWENSSKTMGKTGNKTASLHPSRPWHRRLLVSDKPSMYYYC